MTNTSRRAGSEVVQLYVASPAGAGEPPKQLKGYRKVALQPGGSRRVRLRLRRDDLAVFGGGWSVPQGRYTALVGTSSRDLPLQEGSSSGSGGGGKPQAAETGTPYWPRGRHPAAFRNKTTEKEVEVQAPLHSMAESRSDRRRWFALAVIVAAQFMVVLDVAIVNVALPTIKTDLGFSQENLQWVVTAYSIMFGGVLLLGGRMADLLGRRRLFMAGMALFTASSLLDGLAWSEGSLIAFRLAQGLGAALLSPAALSILTTTFPEGKERNFALGIWGAVSGSGGAAGVLLGGALTSSLSWSWIFFINVPVGVLVLALTPRLVRESVADVAHRHFDVPGAISITGGLMLLVYAMTRAVQHGWGTASARDDRPAGGLGRPGGGLRRHRAAVQGAAAADADVPLTHAVGLEPGRTADGRRRVLAVLPAHPVHAAGVALLGDADGRRLRRADAGGDRLRQRLAGAEQYVVLLRAAGPVPYCCAGGRVVHAERMEEVGTSIRVSTGGG